MTALVSPASVLDDAADKKRLVVTDLCVEFGGIRALEGVSMSAQQGEIVGIIGPNGAGKTTLFNVICGVVRPQSGTLTYGGVPLRRHQPHDLNRLGIARTLQGIGLCAGMTVLENAMLGAEARLRADLGSALLGLWRSSREEAEVAAAARELLDRLEIGAFADRSPATLPYGIQKRVALARALMAEPTLLLLDEPASGLSEGEITALAALIRELSSAMGVVLVEHRMDLVISLCDRVVVLNFGQVIADGPPSEIQANPEVATAYLGRDVDADPPRQPPADA